MYIPMNYDCINMVNSSYTPNTINTRNTSAFDYWERSLFQRACSTIILNLPSEWQGARRDFLYYCLFRNGFVSVFNSPEFGFVFNPCTLNGFDFYYQPTDAIVCNPAFSDGASKTLKIGTDCEILKLTPDYMGIWDIIDYYAEKLAILSCSIDMSLINSRLSWILGAKNKGVANTLKRVLDKINSGEPAVIYDTAILDDTKSKDSPFQFLERKNLKESYLTTDQLQDFQTLLNNFDAEIGIPTIPYAKKERMVQSEADSRVIDSTSRSQVWYDTLNSSIEVVNKHYNSDISISLRYVENEGAEENE